MSLQSLSFKEIVFATIQLNIHSWIKYFQELIR